MAAAMLPTYTPLTELRCGIPDTHWQRFINFQVEQERRPDGCWFYVGRTQILPVQVDRDVYALTPQQFAFLRTHQYISDALPISAACMHTNCVNPMHLHTGRAPMLQQEFMSVQEAARVLDTTVKAVMRAIREDRLPALYLSARSGWRVPWAALYRYGVQ
jgi:hypothetical protein